MDALRAHVFGEGLRVDAGVGKQLRVGGAQLRGDDEPCIGIIEGDMGVVHVDALGQRRGREEQP